MDETEGKDKKVESPDVVLGEIPGNKMKEGPGSNVGEDPGSSMEEDPRNSVEGPVGKDWSVLLHNT